MNMEQCVVDNDNRLGFHRHISIHHDGEGAYISVGNQQVRIINPPARGIRFLQSGTITVHEGGVTINTKGTEKQPGAVVLVNGAEITLSKGQMTQSGVVDWSALYERKFLKNGVPLNCVKCAMGTQGDYALIVMARGASIRVVDWQGLDHFVAYDGLSLVVLPKDHALVRVKPCQKAETKEAKQTVAAAA